MLERRQIEMILRHLVQYVAAIGVEIAGAGVAKRAPAFVGHGHSDAMVAQEGCEGDGPGICADEQDSPSGTAVDPQPPRHPGGRETVRDDGRDDDSEGQRNQSVGIRDSELAHPEGEQPGDRDRNDAARRDPGDEHPLPHGGSRRSACEHCQRAQHDRADPEHAKRASNARSCPSSVGQQ